MRWKLPFLGQALGIGRGGRGGYNTLLLLGVALFGSVGGILSYYLYFKRLQRRDQRGIQQNPQTSTTSETNKPRTEVKSRASGAFPAIKDLTKRTVVTVATIGTVFQYPEVEEGKEKGKTEGEEERVEVIDIKNIEVLKKLAAHSDLHLITLCSNQPIYDYIHSLLLSHGVFTSGLNPVKHLSCSTSIGKAHIARQLESKIHIDSEQDVVSHLQRFTPHLLLVSDKNKIDSNSTPSGDLAYATALSLHQQFIK